MSPLKNGVFERPAWLIVDWRGHPLMVRQTRVVARACIAKMTGHICAAPDPIRVSYQWPPARRARRRKK